MKVKNEEDDETFTSYLCARHMCIHKYAGEMSKKSLYDVKATIKAKGDVFPVEHHPTLSNRQNARGENSRKLTIPYFFLLFPQFV